MLKFPYSEYLDMYGHPLWMPHIDIEFRHGENGLNIFPALVDTGATYSVLPSAIAARLKMTIDRTAATSVSTASGDGAIYRSFETLTCILVDPQTGERVEWEAIVFFSDELETTLIGHKHCLEKFDVVFRGEKKVVEMEPLF